MKNSEKEEKYGSILDILQEMKNSVITDHAAELMVTGVMPKSAQSELKILSGITSAVFCGVNQIGIPITEDEEKPGVVSAVVAGNVYSCSKKSVEDFYSISKENLSASEAVSVSQSGPSIKEVTEAKRVSFETEEEIIPSKEENIPAVSFAEPGKKDSSVEELSLSFDDEDDDVSISGKTLEDLKNEEESDDKDVDDLKINFDESDDEEDEEEVSIVIPEESESSDDFDDIFPKNASEEKSDDDEEFVPFTEEKTDPIPFDEDDEPQSSAEPVVPPVEESDEDEEDEEYVAPQKKSAGALYDLDDDEEFPEEDGNSGEEEPLGENLSVDTEKKEDKPAVFVPLGSNVIGGGNVSSFVKKDFFLDEYEKEAGTFVYSFLKLSVMHKEYGGKPNEVLAMIAPLEIPKHEAKNIKIVVAIWCDHKMSIRSSYDTEREHKNMVQIEAGGYYFLASGSFDENGQFVPTITTTGLSANDRISVIDHKTYGNALERDTKNGHIKFRASMDNGQGVVEVIPFCKAGADENDFICITKSEEFVEYCFISENMHSGKSAIIYDDENVPYELTCEWNDGVATAELTKRGKH